jgi:hypothetical protein
LNAEMCGVFSSVLYGAEWKEKCPAQGLNGGDHGHAKSGASRVICVYLRAASITERGGAKAKHCGVLPTALQQQETNGRMTLPEGAPDLVQRLSRLPIAPNLALLRRRKPHLFPFGHRQHLYREDLHQMVLHRPVETTDDKVSWPKPPRGFPTASC